MFPPSKLSDVKQDSTEQFKITRLPVFRQNWIHLSLQFKGVQTGVLKYIFKNLLVIWLTFYEKQNNGNLDELKQDSYYSLWLDYNNYITVQQESWKPFFVFSDHIMWFSLPNFRYELLSLKVEW